MSDEKAVPDGCRLIEDSPAIIQREGDDDSMWKTYSFEWDMATVCVKVPAQTGDGPWRMETLEIPLRVLIAAAVNGEPLGQRLGVYAHALRVGPRK